MLGLPFLCRLAAGFLDDESTLLQTGWKGDPLDDDLCQVRGPPHSVAGLNFSEPTRVLVFWAASAKRCPMALVRSNIEALRAFQEASQNVTFDVFLAHYDRARWAWTLALGAEWFRSHVRFSEERPGIKFHLAQELLVWSPKKDVDIADYEWLWFLDEDGDLTRTDLGVLLRDADASGAGVVAPALETLEPFFLDGEGVQMHAEKESAARAACQKGDWKCTLQAPHADCGLRHTNFVEVSFPLVRPQLFTTLARIGAIGSDSIWGLDHVWCELAAAQLSIASNQSCAILDRAPIVHRNYRTLPKWHHEEAKAANGRRLSWMYKTFYKFFDLYPKAYDCVTPEADADEGPLSGWGAEDAAPRPRALDGWGTAAARA